MLIISVLGTIFMALIGCCRNDACSMNLGGPAFLFQISIGVFNLRFYIVEISEKLLLTSFFCKVQNGELQDTTYIVVSI